MTNKKNKTKGSAAGQYLGYALQPVRAFFHLLRCESDALVGIEHADDVSVQQNDGTLLVEQCKSALKQNPISNWSEDLWKTFANWIENSGNGFYDPATTRFRLYVTPVRIAKFAQRLSDARSEIDIESVLKAVRECRDNLPKPPVCDKYLRKVLGADEHQLKAIIRNFELVNVDADPLLPIYNHLDSSVSQVIIKEASKWGIGKVERTIGQKIRNNEVPVLSAGEFRHDLRAFIQKYDGAGVLHSLFDAPSDQAVSELVSRAPKFVQQLELVHAGSEVKTAAASNYLQSSADRTSWAEQGFIFETSGDEYDSALKQRHQNVKGEIEITQSTLPSGKRGLLLYHKCCNGAPGKLQGREVPSYFLQGSLNAIADRLEIGWHPDYLELLREEPPNG